LIIYADTSALAKLVLEEQGSAEMEALSAASERTASAAIAYVELHAALTAAIRAGRVPSSSRDDRRVALEQIWGEVYEIAIERPLLQHAARLATEVRLRAYDAVHLAALTFTGETDEVTFACWDTDLRAAAKGLGYALFPNTVA